MSGLLLFSAQMGSCKIEKTVYYKEEHYYIYKTGEACVALERITSRRNGTIQHLRMLANEGAYRAEKGEFLCDGVKLLREALSSGAAVTTLLWKEEGETAFEIPGAQAFSAPADLFDYASPVKNSAGPLFTVLIRGCSKPGVLSGAIVLEDVQDPGNVGTVIRTANAFGIGAVILAGDCADLYHPRTVRATMGAIFRQTVLPMSLDQLGPFLADQRMPLYGAALCADAADVRTITQERCAVAIGSEGHGLSGRLLSLCEKKLIIPMRPDSESLNAAVAAAVVMWEMTR